MYKNYVKHTSVLRSNLRYKERTWSTTFCQSWFWPLAGHLCWSLLVKMLLVTCFLNQPSLSNTTICTENVYTTNVDMRIGEYLHYWENWLFKKYIYIIQTAFPTTWVCFCRVSSSKQILQCWVWKIQSATQKLCFETHSAVVFNYMY